VDFIFFLVPFPLPIPSIALALPCRPAAVARALLGMVHIDLLLLLHNHAMQTIVDATVPKGAQFLLLLIEFPGIFLLSPSSGTSN
jgi:hypothetical protein